MDLRLLALARSAQFCFMTANIGMTDNKFHELESVVVYAATRIMLVLRSYADPTVVPKFGAALQRKRYSQRHLSITAA